MALDLSFTVVERNDNLLLTLTDTTGTYNNPDNTGGWGDPNPVSGFLFADIVEEADVVGTSQYHLILSLTVTTSDGTETTYDDINLWDHNGGSFANAAALVFEFDCSDFEESSVALGLSTDEFPDGIYAFTYKLVDSTTGLVVTATETVTQLIKGIVQNDVYYLLRVMGATYECEQAIKDGILLAVFTKTYLDSMSLLDISARKTSVLNQLYTLERLLTNISSYGY